jgi:hypothetical protein
VANEPKRIKWILDAVTDEIDRCTAWEQGFIASIEAAFNRNGSLSDAQHTVLEKIWEDRCQ